ncbi:hypothetical protein [Butyrivibrio sp. NC2002]|uniref:hypothetical protein n=1 Tax=Butyrivibrio sp. NC2002 TaxID=1410610 RepID=UPI000AC677B4|nr:hypothetical protein [Butyrivibrio sp. NC2002]
MSYSLDFLNMIKNSSENSSKVPTTKRAKKPDKTIAVIDTETNWNDEVMSIGIALADPAGFEHIDSKYYVIDPEYRVGGMFSGVLRTSCSVPMEVVSRKEAISGISDYLKENGVTGIYAYNARFDRSHLMELSGFEWYDIMRIAAYKQFNHSIPDDAALCKSGRLKSGYSVENILKMLRKDAAYSEVHNAIEDAIDELTIMKLLGQGLDVYTCAKL